MGCVAVCADICVRREVCLEYTPVAAVDTPVVVHVGFALTTLDEAEARRTLDVPRARADTASGELGEPLPPGAGQRPRGRSAPPRCPGYPSRTTSIRRTLDESRGAPRRCATRAARARRRRT
ncbi:hypothetical protein GTY60_36400 [Streptomyces sp. SID8367]|uniref:HypC/HybG/HupF family hydrogenase formation chaperone n=1 Tax=Streptomyces sp. PsTaAH-137 TaxID=1305830 RepID=UPI000DB9807D|nr:hypothetical protein [Streptomyces sp. SID8367]